MRGGAAPIIWPYSIGRRLVLEGVVEEQKLGLAPRPRRRLVNGGGGAVRPRSVPVYVEIWRTPILAGSGDDSAEWLPPAG